MLIALMRVILFQLLTQYNVLSCKSSRIAVHSLQINNYSLQCYFNEMKYIRYVVCIEPTVGLEMVDCIHCTLTMHHLNK